jgi:hypothetical protein
MKNVIHHPSLKKYSTFGLISSYFTTFLGGCREGRLATGWVCVLIEIKTISAQLKLELGLSLAKLVNVTTITKLLKV